MNMNKKRLLIVAGIVLALLIAGGIFLAVFLGNRKKASDNVPGESFYAYLKALYEADPVAEIDSILITQNFEINGRTACYVWTYPCMSDDSALKGTERYAMEQKLPEYMGEAVFRNIFTMGGADELGVNGTADWYSVKDGSGTNMSYLVREDTKGRRSIWEFHGFVTGNRYPEDGDPNKFKPYPFGEVLSGIYGIRSAEDIQSITVSPSRRDHTPEGIAYRETIPTIVLGKAKEIEAFYRILSRSGCYGFDSFHNYDGSYPARYQEEFSHYLQYDRELWVELRNGAYLRLPDYDGKHGVFYHMYWQAFEALNDTDMAVMNQLTGIRK